MGLLNRAVVEWHRLVATWKKRKSSAPHAPPRERPRVTETGSEVELHELLDRLHVGGASVAAKVENVWALPEVEDDLRNLAAETDGAGALSEVRAIATRIQQRGAAVEFKGMSLQRKGDLSDLVYRKFDARNIPGKPRFRLVLRPSGPKDWTVVGVGPRWLSGKDHVYEKVRSRLSRLAGLENLDLLAGDEHVTLLFDLDEGTRTEFESWADWTPDPTDESAGRADRWEPLVTTTTYRDAGTGFSYSLTFMGYHHAQREVDQAIVEAQGWLRTRRVAFKYGK